MLLFNTVASAKRTMD